jgi:hypothetical protein
MPARVDTGLGAAVWAQGFRPYYSHDTMPARAIHISRKLRHPADSK